MLETQMNSCTGCRACEIACPMKCISIEIDEQGFLYPKVEAEQCINCGKCNEVCHVQILDKAKLTSERLDEKTVLFGHSKTSSIVEKSSSGGAFSSIAECWALEDGIIVGSAYGKDMYVHHVCCPAKDFDPLYKSKYVFSDPMDTYFQVEKYFQAGKRVLFTGTPCQVAGLKAYLGKEKDELLTMDFICHGTPSMLMLENHIACLEKKYKKKIVKVDFRSKKLGWKQHCFYCKFDDGSEYVKPWREDFYLSLFMGYENLRMCCYNCQYSNKKQVSDITVADFWGIVKYRAELDTDRGESLLIANTVKGRELLNLLYDKGIMELQKVEEEYWSYIYKVHKYPIDRRNQFFAKYKKEGYECLEKRFQTLLKVKHLCFVLKNAIKKIINRP